MVVSLAARAADVRPRRPPAAADEPHGSNGIGDPYFPLDGNGGINVLSYDVHDRYQFGERRLSGWTRIVLRPTETLSGFNLDFLLPVRSVKLDGHEVDFDQTEFHELVGQPPASSRARTSAWWSGTPASRGSYTYDGESNWLASGHEVVAMNQPHMAPWWFPANDHPLDKAQITVSITVPKAKQVIGNGHLVGPGRRTATWRRRPGRPTSRWCRTSRSSRPATSRSRRAPSHGHEWYSAVSKRLPDNTQHRAMSLMKRSSQIVAWIEDALGADYPFSTTGGVATSLKPGFALENQTRPTYERGSLNVATVVHELAHQWFGDSVAVEGWKDIWLNEGSATFFEAYYDEDHGGPSADTWLRDALRQHRRRRQLLGARGRRPVPGAERLRERQRHLRRLRVLPRRR